jgi:hypothetical protein
MKGTIAKCLEELVVTQFGRDKWEQSLKDVGLSPSTVFWPMSDIDDAQVMGLVEAVCKNLSITLVQAADAFGAYWVNVYSQRMYPLYYERNATARDFLLDMDNVHMQATRTMEKARPPRFDYEWKDDRSLIMHYKSERGLIDFVVGLARGVGKYYGENIEVSKLGPDKVQIVFAQGDG